MVSLNSYRIVDYLKCNNLQVTYYEATPNGCLVSGPVDFQIRMWAGSIGHYIIMPISDEMLKRLLFFRLVTAFLVTCENEDVQ